MQCNANIVLRAIYINILEFLLDVYGTAHLHCSFLGGVPLTNYSARAPCIQHDTQTDDALVHLRGIHGLSPEGNNRISAHQSRSPGCRMISVVVVACDVH